MALTAGVPPSFAVGFSLAAISAFTGISGTSQLAHHPLHVNYTRHRRDTEIEGAGFLLNRGKLRRKTSTPGGG